MFNTCPWSCPLIIQLLSRLGCGWAAAACEDGVLSWGGMRERGGARAAYAVAAPLSFLNVTGVVTKSCSRAGRNLSLGGGSQTASLSAQELSYPSLGWFWRCTGQSAAGDEGSVDAGAGFWSRAPFEAVAQ